MSRDSQSEYLGLCLIKFEENKPKSTKKYSGYKIINFYKKEKKFVIAYLLIFIEIKNVEQNRKFSEILSVCTFTQTDVISQLTKGC